MTEEGTMNKEWLDELAAATNDELIEKLRFFSCDPYFYDLFDPLVEEIQKRLNKAEPVRRGHWVEGINDKWVCSECGIGNNYAYSWDVSGYKLQDRYCPNCGAKMEEQEAD